MFKPTNPISRPEAVKRINEQPYHFAYIEAAIYAGKCAGIAEERRDSPVAYWEAENQLILLKQAGAMFNFTKALSLAQDLA